MNSLNSYTKENFKSLTIFSIIFLSLIFIILSYQTIISFTNQKIIESTINNERIVETKEIQQYIYQNDSAKFSIIIPNNIKNNFMIIYNKSSKEYIAKSKYYPYSEFIGQLVILFLIGSFYILYLIRMKSKTP